MKRKVVFGTVLALSLAMIIVVAAVAPTLAHGNADDSSVVFYSEMGTVSLQLPPAPNKTGTGTPAHPTNLHIAVTHWDRRSAFGSAGYSLLTVSLWIPQANSFTPVAYITNYNDADFLSFIRTAWNGTAFWIEKTTVPPSDFKNVIAVAPNELEVSRHGDIVTANLTREVNISLPFNILPPPAAVFGNQTFTLPPLFLELRGIDTPSKEETTLTLPSGYVFMNSGWEKPALASAEIPKWLGSQPLRAVGTTRSNWKFIYTAP